MNTVGVIWHVANFFAPALFVGLVSACAVKLLWRRAAQASSWWILAGWSVATCAIVLVVGIALFGRDGKVLTYLAMTAACAAVQLRYVGLRNRP